MDIKQLHKMLTLLIINLDESFNALQASQEAVEFIGSPKLIYTCIDCSKETGRD